MERDTARASLAPWTELPAGAVPARSALPAGAEDLDASASPSVRRREAGARAAEAERTLASRLLFSSEVRAGDQTQRDPAGTERSGPVLSASLSLPLFGRGQAESARIFLLLSLLALAGIHGLLYLSFRSHRHTAIVLVNLPLALIGGVFAVAAGGNVLSIATAVGFFTLFGVAGRNGVLLVSRYERLLAEGVSLREAVFRGSEEGWRRSG